MIEILATICIGASKSNENSQVFAKITLSPQSLIDQLNAFGGKVATKIKDGLFQEVALNGKAEGDVNIRLFFDDLILDFVRNVSLTPTKQLKNKIDSVVNAIKKQIVLELSHAMLCNTKFCSLKVSQRSSAKSTCRFAKEEKNV